MAKHWVFMVGSAIFVLTMVVALVLLGAENGPTVLSTCGGVIQPNGTCGGLPGPGNLALRVFRSRQDPARGSGRHPTRRTNDRQLPGLRSLRSPVTISAQAQRSADRSAASSRRESVPSPRTLSSGWQVAGRGWSREREPGFHTKPRRRVHRGLE